MAHENSQPAPVIRAAAAVYDPQTSAKFVLAGFAKKLQGQGLKVGGIVQEFLLDNNDNRCGLDAIDVDTGERIPINRPTASDKINGVCSLDHSALTEPTGALRRAINKKSRFTDRQKFGEQEQKGSGLADEMPSAMAEGITTLVLVPASALDQWNRFSGNKADLIPCTLQDIENWWND